MDLAQTSATKPAGEQSPAQLAKGALRRLATERLEPTPENYARAYRLEAGNPKGSSVLPQRAQRILEAVASRAFDADATHASAEFSRAMAEGQWDHAERAMESAPGAAGEALALLIERIVRGVERGGQNWTVARRKVGIQRVLDASRADTRRLQQRLTQLVTSWEGDPVSALAHLEEEPVASKPAAPASDSLPMALDLAAAEGLPTEPVRPTLDWGRATLAMTHALQRRCPPRTEPTASSSPASMRKPGA